VAGAGGPTDGPEITFEVMDDKLPVETPPDDPFVRLCRRSYRSSLDRRPRPVAGVEPGRSKGEADSLSGASYFSDAAVLCPALGLPRVIIGPGEMGMSGQRDEYVCIERLVAAADIYLQIARDFLLG
jgi:succinyl-diaminopimelate desuccinylase